MKKKSKVQPRKLSGPKSKVAALLALVVSLCAPGPARAQTQERISLLPTISSAASNDDFVINQWTGAAYDTKRMAFKNLVASLAATNGVVTPFQFGALGGGNDDTVAFSNAVNSGNAVYVPTTTNYTVSKLFLSNNAVLFSYGAKITMKAGTTGFMIDTTTATNFWLWNLYLDGGNPPDTNVAYWQPAQGTRSGIRTFVFAANSAIENVTANNFTDTGFLIGDNGLGSVLQIGPVSTSQSMRQSPLRFANNEARGNYYGIHVAGYDANNVQEYFSIQNCNGRNDYYGLQIDSGNIYVQGGLFTGNNYGTYVCNCGPNNAHGLMLGTSLNHNTVSILCDGISTGFTFDALKIIGGGNYIKLHNCTGVTIQNSQLDLDYGINDGGATNFLRNNFWFTSDPATVWTNANGGTLIKDGNLQVLGNGQAAVNERLGSSNWFPGSVNITGTRLLSVNSTNSGNVQTATLNVTGAGASFFFNSAYANGQLLATGAVATVSVGVRGGSGTATFDLFSPSQGDFTIRDNADAYDFLQFRANAGSPSLQPGYNGGTDLGTTTQPWAKVIATNSIGGRLPTLTKTGNYTISGTTDLIGTYVNNSGAGGAVTNTLPAATAGLHYGLNVDAAQNLAFKATGTDTIRNAATISAAGGLLFASTIGNSVHIVCHVAGKWVVESLVGTWTAQ